MFHLQDVFLGSDIIRSIVRRYRRRELRDDFATIHGVAHIVDSHACFCLSRCLDSFVHMMTVHADPAELRQKGRVKIHHSVVIGIDKEIRNHQQEACENNEPDPELLHKSHHAGFIVELLLRHDY